METTEESIPETPAERPLRRQARSPKSRRWIIGAFAAVVTLLVLFLGTALYTDRPQFCGTCHEMRPYDAAWAAGPHKDLWCVDCHIGKSYPARFAHKFVALGEVVAHFSGDATFPRPTASHVGDAACVACHPQVKPKRAAAGFDHAVHEREAPCQACHADTGHAVDRAGLTAAGVFNPNVVRAPFARPTATVGQGSANIPGHAKVACTRCHDMKKTGCAACHALSAKHFKPRSGNLPACAACHGGGATWAFTHPTDTKCQECHTPSAKHFRPPSGELTPCAQCHAQAGKSWAFTHPGQSSECTDCHAVPASHFKPASGTLAACSQCHAQRGVSWKFSHPGSRSDCGACHTAPASHPEGQCSKCHHKTGVSFAFSHPSSGAPHGVNGIACNRCHPDGFTTHSCTCH